MSSNISNIRLYIKNMFPHGCNGQLCSECILDNHIHFDIFRRFCGILLYSEEF